MKGNLMTWDDVKVVVASVTGLGVQLTDIELLVKIGVGIATIVYIVAKTVTMLKGKKEG